MPRSEPRKRFRKKPVVIEATQWFKNGDHPDDNCELIQPVLSHKMGGEDTPFLSEGKVVRYFCRPDVSEHTLCQECGQQMHSHGWIDTREGGHIVCPGDWIITGVQGERYPCKPDIFDATYEPVAARQEPSEAESEAFLRGVPALVVKAPLSSRGGDVRTELVTIEEAERRLMNQRETIWNCRGLAHDTPQAAWERLREECAKFVEAVTPYQDGVGSVGVPMAKHIRALAYEPPKSK